MYALRSAAVAAGLLVAVAFSGPGWAQPSGQVVAVVQMAESDGVTGRIVLRPESPIFSGDRIVTGSVGEAQIRFRDNTRLVVGPNSAMTIDAFVFDGDTARNVSINATRGLFRFLSGNSPKDAYSITTPTATIGVRGTEFDVDVEPSTGTTRVVNFTGITRICRRDNLEVRDPNNPDRILPQCVETRAQCGVSIVRPQRGIFEYRDPRDRNRAIAGNFRYVRDQSGLLDDFRVDVGACGDLAVVQPEPASDPSPDSPPPPPPSPDPEPCKKKCGDGHPHKPPHHGGPHKPPHHGGPHHGGPKGSKGNHYGNSMPDNNFRDTKNRWNGSGNIHPSGGKR